MKIVKAVASGLATVTAAALVMSIPIVASMLKYPTTEGYFVVMHWRLWAVFSISALVFSTGFLWQYHRSR